jgi:uncharacterized protein YkwD
MKGASARTPSAPCFAVANARSVTPNTQRELLRSAPTGPRSLPVLAGCVLAMTLLALAASVPLLAAAPQRHRPDRSSGTLARETLRAVQSLRRRGCGRVRAAPALLHATRLDRTAQRLASGDTPIEAARHSGYLARSVSEIRLSGALADQRALEALLARSSCRALLDPALEQVGVYARGGEVWIALAVPSHLPSRTDADAIAARVLALVNAARGRGERCGARPFAPAPALAASATLNAVALAHATDMIEYDYFDHQDRQGRSPAQRVLAAGYPARLVGENIAKGPQSAREAVEGWLASPPHCANLMNPQFTRMGIGYAVNRLTGAIDWVQELAAPR